MGAKLQISLSDERPIRIDVDNWPLVASARWFNGQHECQANRKARVCVREHKDARRIVYGWTSSAWAGEDDAAAGYRLAADATDEDLIRAIRRVAGAIGRHDLGEACIHDLPARDIDDATDAVSAAIDSFALDMASK